MDDGVQRFAVDVNDTKEYEAFKASFGSGRYLAMTVYSVPQDKLIECPAKGRAPSALVKNRT